MYAHMSLHLRVDVLELGADGRDQSLDAGSDLGGGQLQAQPLRHQHREQLSAAGDQSRELALLRIGQRADKALQIAAPQEHCGQFGQGFGVDTIGLRELAHGLGEMASLLGIDHRHGKAGSLQRTGHCRFVAAGGLHDDQGHAERLQRCGQRRMTVDIVRKMPNRQLRAERGAIDMRLRHVDAHYH